MFFLPYSSLCAINLVILFSGRISVVSARVCGGCGGSLPLLLPHCVPDPSLVKGRLGKEGGLDGVGQFVPFTRCRVSLTSCHYETDILAILPTRVDERGELIQYPPWFTYDVEWLCHRVVEQDSALATGAKSVCSTSAWFNFFWWSGIFRKVQLQFQK